MDIVLKVLVRVAELPRKVTRIAPGDLEELNYHDLMIRRFNPEMVPAIWVYGKDEQSMPLINEPITPEEVRDYEDIVIIQEGEFFHIQKFRRSLKNQLREYFQMSWF